MKPRISFVAILSALALGLQSSLANPAILTMNFSSNPTLSGVPGSSIQFNGSSSSFQFDGSNFSPSSPFAFYNGSQWSISTESGGTGSALGLLGSILNGPFSYGSIVTNGNVQTANVLGPLGGLNINDGAGNFLTGNVDLMQVQTAGSIGGIGDISASIVVNITGLNYLGANADLQTLLNNGSGSINLSFQFSPGMTLGQLSSGTGPYNTSYSGSISTVPEPGPAILVAMGLIGLFIVRRCKKGQSQTIA